MAGQPGQTHARLKTQAERDVYALTKIEQFLDKVREGKNKRPVDPVRLKAAEIRYSKLRASLSAVEQTQIVPDRSEAEIMAELRKQLADNPKLIDDLMPGYTLVRLASFVDTQPPAAPESPDAAQQSPEPVTTNIN